MTELLQAEFPVQSDIVHMHMTSHCTAMIILNIILNNNSDNYSHIPSDFYNCENCGSVMHKYSPFTNFYKLNMYRLHLKKRF